ncbi:Rid family hydrolase [Burkholderia pseudomallei]|uniref:Rid family hydrolase n=1 Tax=Burkholderia pseudomallei TaxID=28450 RepID=UPI0005727073|nr:Rid family hydrolase [Burkholderia pseudomallei]ARL41178.1 hypothetical protein BOC49_35625 [Burkholderia pseudomallei]ONC27423.1 hypothetical protein AQ914_03405 [Burkholderia pseudomallei]ONC68109.1 hypothetical protein AQ922_19395 [Burkholderia pseudomallei]ONC98224.1 hypothetical protein AQ926_17315 [Burkholderia pseudomallei]ONC99581.1 hypothetical protein AQ925_02005 [Burkholderia pseudomallei]
MVDAPTAVRALAASFGRGAIGLRATRVFPGARGRILRAMSDEPRILQAQMRLAFDNLNACLSAAGSTFDDVVDVTIVVVDPPSISTRSGRSRPATGATRRIRRRPASA